MFKYGLNQLKTAYSLFFFAGMKHFIISSVTVVTN